MRRRWGHPGFPAAPERLIARTGRDPSTNRARGRGTRARLGWHGVIYSPRTKQPPSSASRARPAEVNRAASSRMSEQGGEPFPRRYRGASEFLDMRAHERARRGTPASIAPVRTDPPRDRTRGGSREACAVPPSRASACAPRGSSLPGRKTSQAGLLTSARSLWQSSSRESLSASISCWAFSLSARMFVADALSRSSLPTSSSVW
jgi:hypothetical protein